MPTVPASLMECPHASPDRRKADRPRHQVDRPRRRARAHRRHGLPRRQARRRQEQRAVLVGPVVRGVDQGGRPAVRARSTPTTSRRSSPTTAPAASPTTTSPPSTSRPPRSPRSTASPTTGVLTPNAAAALQAQGAERARRCCPRTARWPTSTSRSTSARTAGTRSRSPSTRSSEITAIDGVDVYVGGFGGQAYDFISSFDGSHVTLLLMTFGVVILILLFTYRSPVLWMLPIFCAVVANTMAGGVVYLLAKYAGLAVNDQSQYILSILVIGAGTDYALLLVARYREELRRHEDRHEAMAFALHRAAPAIIASAATVVVGLMCLSFADLNSTAEPRSGPGRRRRGDPAGHGHPAARAAGDLRPLDLLAGAARRSAPREPTQTGFWARVGDRISGAPARRLDRRPPSCSPIACLGPVQARRQRPVHRGRLHRDARLGHRPEAAGRPRPGRQLQHASRW